MNNILRKTLSLLNGTRIGHTKLSKQCFSINKYYLRTVPSNFYQSNRFYSSSDRSSFSAAPPPEQDPLGTALLDLITYESICSDTLESLCEYFDQLVDSTPHLKDADVNLSDGVLTVNFGRKHGIYVINRQTPNKQIWLSSPLSGPKRYDFVPRPAANTLSGFWIYKHDGIGLHELLQKEIQPIVGREVEFMKLPFGSRNETS